MFKEAVMKAIPIDEYQRRLKAFIAEKGPNQGIGYYGSWSWHGRMEWEFRKRFRVYPIMPESTARPGSFTDFWRRSRS